jgi:hypothetical protein
MVVMAICGEMGSGKTLTMTYLAYTKFYKHNIPVFANYGFKYRNKFLKKSDELKKLQDGCLALDEIWLWLDSRAFMKRKNKFLSTILLKSRRRGLHILYTAQDFSQVDKRLRNVTDIICYPELSQKTTKCYVHPYMVGSGKKLPIFVFKTKSVFSMYDHKENLDYLDEDDDDDL